ncbi:MAG: dockerin type I domain-containing protein [Candidatus Zixiibacteriota bacterium]
MRELITKYKQLSSKRAKFSQIIPLLVTLVLLHFFATITLGSDNWIKTNPRVNMGLSSSLAVQSDTVLRILIPASELRHLGLHNSGKWNFSLANGRIPSFGGLVDPETGEISTNASFPKETSNSYIYTILLWIGGVVDIDTLVSTAADQVTLSGGFELLPGAPQVGGMKRTGNFADDEFVAFYSDTISDPRFNGVPNQFEDDPTHVPLGIEIKQESNSWADNLYDDFVLIKFTLKNILNKDIKNGWAGLYIDPDIYNLNTSAAGWTDDISGLIDTLIDEGDPASRLFIPYCFDNNGDPEGNSRWDSSSVRGAVSLRLVASSFENPIQNFNWWVPSGNPNIDFGPRMIGTTEDPYRVFTGGFTGSPYRQQDKYYMMAHSEIDYDQLFVAIMDSTDGWIPPADPTNLITADTRFLLSFGPFDLPPGDSVWFTVACVVSDSFHVEPNDYARYFDPESPSDFKNRLDFSRIIDDHRRIDSVYNSNLLLPKPGPPVGLEIVESLENSIKLTWNRCQRPDIYGYNVYVKDTVTGNKWHRSSLLPIIDTTFVFSGAQLMHHLMFSVSALDTSGRESGIAFYRDITFGRPLPPGNLDVQTEDGLPLLSWKPPSDTGLYTYYIYRSRWRETFGLYDSTVSLIYKDAGVETGISYRYYLTANSILNLESFPSNEVTFLYMSMDEGILFVNGNLEQGPQIDAYRAENVMELMRNVNAGIDVTYQEVWRENINLNKMSRYETVIIDVEKSGVTLSNSQLDSLAIYLSNGGNVMLIMPNVSQSNPGMNQIFTIHYGDGDFFHDYLFLDSVLVNGFAFQNGAIVGDLEGSLSEMGEYPNLLADTQKLLTSTIPIEGYIPLSGCLFPEDFNVETIYRYNSSFPDSVMNNQINGIRYLGDDYRTVLFNFPLSLMSYPGHIKAFRQGLRDLGVDVDCGDANNDKRVNISDAVYILNYLYLGGTAPDKRKSDLDCNDVVELADVLILINRVFRKGYALSCCPN